MKLRIRVLRLRVETASGVFGCDLKFGDGLVLLRADNTKGKSTCLMSMLYALGLEGMLGPSQVPPLPPVLMSQIMTDRGPERVVFSKVWLEIEGAEGRATVSRDITATNLGRQRIEVIYGPALSQPSDEYTSQDFFIRTKGDSFSEAGFHRFLAEFVGWKFPKLTKFDGTPTILYPACLAPYFFVDQLSGWRDIKARMPTYLQIPEMSKRSAEYLLSLDILDIAIRHLELEEREEALKKRWNEMRAALRAALPRIGTVVRGFTEVLPDGGGENPRPYLVMSTSDGWMQFVSYTEDVRDRLAILRERNVTSAAHGIADGIAELRRLEESLARAVRRFEQRQAELYLAKEQVGAVERRLSDLRDDLRQFDDDRRIRARNGRPRLQAANDECPTCGQHIEGVLLPEGTSLNPMTLDENVAFLRDQIATFREMHEDAKRAADGTEQSVVAASTVVGEISAQVRAQKELIQSRSDSPSVAEVQERLSLESRLEQIEKTEEVMDELQAAIDRFMVDWRQYHLDKTLTGPERLTENDQEKLRDLELRFLTQLREYGFESYNINAMGIGTETYRPVNEGMDLGITSASDAIRSIWAYLLGFLETARTHQTNHPGLLIFDEPKQQMVKDFSFTALVDRAVLSKAFGQQVIFATSQPLSQINEMVAGRQHQLINFDSRIIFRIS